MGDRCGIGFLVLNFDPRFKRKPGKEGTRILQTEGEEAPRDSICRTNWENNDL